MEGVIDYLWYSEQFQKTTRLLSLKFGISRRMSWVSYIPWIHRPFVRINRVGDEWRTSKFKMLNFKAGSNVTTHALFTDYWPRGLHTERAEVTKNAEWVLFQAYLKFIADNSESLKREKYIIISNEIFQFIKTRLLPLWMLDSARNLSLYSRPDLPNQVKRACRIVRERQTLICKIAHIFPKASAFQTHLLIISQF